MIGKRARTAPLGFSQTLGAVAIIAALASTGCDASGVTRAVAGERGVRPGRLVHLEGSRSLNLRCSGRGSPTVVLEAGWGGDSSAWVKVQPTVARTTRVCAYDRAGNGFSDPGPLPRDGAAIARDLDRALTAAGINGPLILVGHSAGALYMRLFAARRQNEVEGLILVDPTIERRQTPPKDGLDGIRRRLQRCLAAAEAASPLPPGDPQWTGCLPKKGNAALVAAARRPETWRNQLSELDSIFGRTSDEVMRLKDLLRGVPVYVLTASASAESAPALPFEPSISSWEFAHERLATAGAIGFQRTVSSSHLIMVDRPDAVIQAIEAMIAASREGRPPDPLPPSERPPDEDRLKELFAPIEPFRFPGPDIPK